VPLLHLNYIAHYRPHFRCCYYFASHKKCAILLHLTWLNGKKLGFTFFLLYSHKGWTASLVCDSVYSLLDSGWFCFLLSPLYFELHIGNIVQLWCNNNVLLNCTTVNNKWRNNYQYFFFRICTQTPVWLTGPHEVWMRDVDLKNFIMTHQHTEAKNHFP